MRVGRKRWCFVYIILMLSAFGGEVYAEHLSCVVCEAGTYCFNDASYTCPTHSNSLEKSGNVTECQCLSGYFKVDQGDGSFSCESCHENSYCFHDNLYSCPPNSTSVVLSSAVTDCKCKAGFSGTISSVNDMESCQACPSGTYKTLVGDTSCIDCDAGKYAELEASDTAANCLSCPAFASAPPGSNHLSDCLCQEGYEAQGENGNATCSACDTGKFNHVAGGSCQECGGSTYAPSQGLTTCIDCPVNTGHELTRQTSLASCTCDHGFVLTADVCTPCVPGSYNSGTDNCLLCPNGTFSSTYAATLCELCPDFSTSLQGSNQAYNCTCHQGYEWTGESCVGCQVGHYKAGFGNLAHHVCESCPLGTYAASPNMALCTTCANSTFQNLTGQTTCQTCQAHSTSEEGSTDSSDCKCLPGYYFCHDCQQCKPCDKGFFKETTANEQCTSCESGYFTTTTASTSSDDCGLCPANFYLENDGNGGITCEACPPNSGSLAGGNGISSCACMPGYTGTNDGCVQCELGKYKPSSGSQSCTVCPDGFIGLNSTQSRMSVSLACTQCGINRYTHDLSTCGDCPDNTMAPIGSNEITDCKCLPGYTGEDGLACSPCGFGTYKETVGSSECILCSSDTYQSQTNATSVSSCLPCPEDTTSDGNSGSSDICLCQAGYTLENGACVSCAGGSYKITSGSHACTLCSTGTYYDGHAPFSSNQCKSCPANSQNAAAGVGIQSCLCQVGYIKQDGACRPCNEGFYCASETQETQCYIGSSSPQGSSNVNDCSCLPGYYANCTGESCHQSCLLCPVNFYCHGGNTEAQECPLESSTLTLAGTTSITACKCNPGWHEANNETGVCVECSANTYCAGEQEFHCPANSTALAGTDSIAKCYCDEYFTRDAANECHLCGSHLVCEGVQNIMVDGAMTLQAGNIDICTQGSFNKNQKCVCLDGTYCNDGTSNASCLMGSTCNECPVGSRCSNNMLTNCGPNRTSDIRSYHTEHCRCKEGYYLTENGQCLICPVGAFCTNETLTWCSEFDSSLTTIDLGMHSRDHCLCPLGKFRLHSNDTCKTCPRNYFCPSETYTLLPNAVACSKNEFTLTTGNVERAACTCAAGFVMSSESQTFMECLPCPPGHRCSGGTVLEFFCHLSNRTANEDHSECVCQAGFEQNSEQNCAPCQQGYVKAHIGNDACMPCNHGNYYLNSTTCLSCESNEGSSDDYLSCVCNAPLVKRESDNQCVECAENHYYSAGQCHACPVYSSTNGLTGQSSISACQCISGYHDSDVETDNLVCESCPVGFYEVGGECQSCGTDAITDSGSTAASDCYCNATLCHNFVWGEACSGLCEVSPVACEACSPGHYKATVSALGNTDVCTKCHANQYQPLEGQSSCLNCHETRTNPHLASSSSDDCICKKGFEEIDNSSTACSACLDGHFKQDIGNYHCSACAMGSFASGLQNTACLSCSTHSTIPDANTTLQDASTHADNCTCLSGYMLEQDSLRCVQCQQGSFKSKAGDHDCRLCGEDITEAMVHDLHDTIHRYGDNEVAAVSNNHCLGCPPNSGQDPLVVTEEVPMNEITDCLCFPSHDSFDESTGCQHCSEGTDWKANYSFKIGYSNQDCQLCEAGKYFEGHNVACDTCVLNDADNATRHHTGILLNAVDQSLPWGTSFEDCDCGLGSTRITDMCHDCPVGFYRNDSSLRACQSCGMNEYQDEKGQTECKACPANSYAETTQNTAITDCLCEAGYEWNDNTQTCDECTAGTQKGRGTGTCQACPQNTYSLARSPLCTACGPNERSSPGSGSPFSCNCNPGFGSLDGAQCSICGNGTFSGGGQEAATNNPSQQRPACQQCPLNKNSTHGSTERGNCKCIPGHGDPSNNADDGAQCSPCENGFYASGGNNIACFSCGFGAITEPPQAAFAFSCCQCDAGRGLYEQ